MTRKFKESDMTLWFDGRIKPVHIGVYARQFGADGVVFSYWNGEFWSIAGSNPERAFASLKTSIVSPYQTSKLWRGLKEQAK